MTLGIPAAMGIVPKSVWVLLALALALRLGAGELLSERLPPGNDESAYRVIAASIADGEGFPDRPAVAGGGPSAASPPGYPYLLAGVFALAGEDPDAARAFQALLGTLTVALVGLVAWLVFRRRDVALAALGLAAVYPPLLVLGAPLLTESLLAPLLLGAVAAALLHRERGGLGWVLLAGVLGGLAGLTKDVGLVALAVVAVAIWPRPRLSRASLRAPALALVAAALVMLPWTIRNAVEFDAFVPVSTKLGHGLAGTYNETVREDAEHVWRPTYQLPEFRELLFDSELDEAEASRELQRRALEFAREHPGYPLAVSYWNARRMLQLRTSPLNASDAELLGFDSVAAEDPTLKAAYWACAAAFAILAALLVASLARRELGGVPRFLLVLPVLLVLPLLPIAGGPRYRLPAELFLIVLAAPAVAALAARLRRRRAESGPHAEPDVPASGRPR